MKSPCLIALATTLTVRACLGGEFMPPVFSPENEINRRPASTTAYQGRNITDGDAPALARFQGLLALDFTAGLAIRPAKITDKGLAEIAKLDLPKLRSLSVGWNDEVTDAGLAHLARLRPLTFLGLASCPKLTDAGLRHLIGLKGPVDLDLRANPNLTDEGIQQLAAKKDWGGLNFDGCPKITPEGVAKLQAALPGVPISKLDSNWQLMGPDATNPKWRQR